MTFGKSSNTSKQNILEHYPLSNTYKYQIEATAETCKTISLSIHTAASSQVFVCCSCDTKNRAQGSQMLLHSTHWRQERWSRESCLFVSEVKKNRKLQYDKQGRLEHHTKRARQLLEGRYQTVPKRRHWAFMPVFEYPQFTPRVNSTVLKTKPHARENMQNTRVPGQIVGIGVTSGYLQELANTLCICTTSTPLQGWPPTRRAGSILHKGNGSGRQQWREKFSEEFDTTFKILALRHSTPLSSWW